MGRQGEGSKCFLCYSKVFVSDNSELTGRSQFFGVSGQLVKEMSIIFVIRKVLSVPKSVCYKLVESVGSPSSWGIRFCSKCSDLISDAQGLLERIEHFQLKLQKLSDKIQSDLFKNINANKRSVQPISGRSWETVDELRFQFSKEFNKTVRTKKLSTAIDADEKLAQQIRTLSLPNTSSSKSDDKIEISRQCFEDEFKETKLKRGIEQETFLGDSDAESFGLGDFPEHDSESTVSSNSDFSDFKDFSESQTPRSSEATTQKASLQQCDKNVKSTSKSKVKSKVNTEKSTENTLLKFQCTEEKCKKRYATEADRDIHVKKVHKGDMFPHECNVCSKKFPMRSRLVAHQKVHEPKKSVPAPDKPAPIYSCDSCEKTFKSKTAVVAHMKSTVHLVGPKPFMCELCSKTFQASLYLEQHQQLFHYELLNLEPIKCKECGKVFAKERSLNWHIKATHKKEFKFTCSVCPTGFEYESSLAIHMRIHTGAKPYVCSICSRSFRVKYRLNSHMRIHTGEKPYKCIECGKMFSDKPTFNRHMEYHKGVLFDCTECSRQYPTRHALRVHIRSAHEGKCQIKQRMSKVRRAKRRGRRTAQMSPETSTDSNSLTDNIPQNVISDPSYHTAIPQNHDSTANVANFVAIPQNNIVSYPTPLIPQNHFSTYSTSEENRVMPQLLPSVPFMPY